MVAKSTRWDGEGGVGVTKWETRGILAVMETFYIIIYSL